MRSLKFKDYLHKRPRPSGLDVFCRLQHFAIITYAVNPQRFANLIPDRFALDLVEIKGEMKALISVVPFADIDFTSAVFPFPNFTMGQTNYRIYIVDKKSGEKCVWFLGTTLDSWTRIVPHRVWRLPWYAGKIDFTCTLNEDTQRYERYIMRTEGEWAPAFVELKQPENLPLDLPGFPDIETGLVVLTHPLTGFYHRRDGKLGGYQVWHKRLEVSPAELISADFGLLSRIGLVTKLEQQTPHSVLIQPVTEFTIYLPPKVWATVS